MVRVKYIIQSDTTLYFIKLYHLIPATCFGPICRVISCLSLKRAECTINNAFNLRDLVLQELVKIIVMYYMKNWLK